MARRIRVGAQALRLVRPRVFPAAVASLWVKRELLYSLQESRFEGRIVPVLHESCVYDELSWTLTGMQTVDFTGGFESGCRSLLRIWGVGFHPRAP